MNNSISPVIAERAVQWLVELQSPPVAEHTLVEWHQWRAQNPEHERAWQRIEGFGERFAGLVEHAQLTQAMLGTTPQQDASMLSRRQALKLLALLVSVGSAAWAGRDTALWQNLYADYHSAVGEQRHLTLVDGTKVLLNTDSAINVRFDADQRSLRLLRGEIQVQVQTARDMTTPPLLAHTRQGHIETTGSEFLLRQAEGYSRVAVNQGQLRLFAGQYSGGVLLQAGQQAMFSADEMGPVRPVSDADRAWTDGIIIANDQRLEDFLAELSRYRAGHLGCSSAVAGIRVAGTYPLADTDRILQTLGATLKLRVRRFTPYWVSLDRLA